MPRTVNAEVHKLRRDAFLDVAQHLIQTKGYEQMSIQDVLDKLEASRGALYHYFDSKQALLDGVVDRFADNAMTTVAPILADRSLPALRKLERVLGGIARFKAEQKELVLAIMEVWNSDGNALVREKVRRMTASRLGPILSMVIRQGVSEGTIIVSSSPDETARVIQYLMQGYQELAGEHFLARQAGTISFEDVLRTYAAFTEAFERILGIPTGSATLMDEATLRFWFG
jgi:AcrR family transcriptional regulator